MADDARSRETHSSREIDVARAERGVAELLAAFGYSPDSERFAETPKRVVDAFRELTSGEVETLSVFANEEGYRGPIVLQDIEVLSLCEHHLLPFRGTARIVYIPRDLIAGFSGLARTVDAFAKRPGLQEELTVDIASFLFEQLDPLAVGVLIEAEHFCMIARGSKAHGTSVVTRELRGELASDPELIMLMWAGDARNEQVIPD